MKDKVMSCAKCQTHEDLTMVSMVREGRLVGYLFTCPSHFKHIAEEVEVDLTPRESK